MITNIIVERGRDEMKYKKRMKQLLAKGLALIVLVTGGIYPGPMCVWTAAAEDLSADWINVTGEHLELGTEGNDTFDFNIVAEAPEVYDGAYWYINKDKGTPDCIEIDHKTGVVTAKRAGTAYVRCKITRVDKLVVRPEAKVTVYNKITEVSINNLPANLSIPAGKTMDFNRTVINTATGKKAKTNGITRWEVAEDTAGVGEASAQGQILPVKEGIFKLRAVCFKNQADYRLWLANKKKNSSRITAASSWATIKVTASNNKGYAATQEELVKLLMAPGITEITCDVGKFTDITIPDGNYQDKTIILSTPDNAVEPTAAYGEINSFTTASGILESQDRPGTIFMRFSENSLLGYMISNYPGMAVILLCNGYNNIQGIQLQQQTNLTITSEQLHKVLQVTLGIRAEGSTVSSNTPISATFTTPVRFNLLPGSAGSTFYAPKPLIQNINLNNQSGDFVNLIVDNINIPIESGSRTTTDELIKKVNPDPPPNAGLKERPRVSGQVTSSTIIKGQKVSASVLTGAFINSRNETVSGTFTWELPNMSVISSSKYIWIFTPTDTLRYEQIIGSILITLRPISEVLSEAKALVRDAILGPLPEEGRADDAIKMAAMKAAIQTLVGTISPDINVEVVFQDDEYIAKLSMEGEEVEIPVTENFYY